MGLAWGQRNSGSQTFRLSYAQCSPRAKVVSLQSKEDTMTKRIRLVQSPFNPPIQAVDDIVFNLHVPCSTKQVTIQVNPNVEHYPEDAEATHVQVRADRKSVV